MQPNPMVFRRIARAFVFSVLFPALVFAQASKTPARIIETIDETRRTPLIGNTHPLARAEFDRGRAPSDLPLNRMLLVLQRSPDQEAALQTLLDQQQDKSSPNYHAWLTPEQFGQQFGPADSDIQTITNWLASHGFQVNRVAKGRTTVEFSGTVGQVSEAFRTEIHKYSVNGEDHWANASDPQIPTALTSVVAGIATLHNFLKKPQLVMSPEKFQTEYRPGMQPQVTSSTGVHALGPADFATIYNVTPLSSSLNGYLTQIAVVGRSNIDLQDVLDFRSLFGLPAGFANVFLNGPDPGNLGGEEEAEAVLDTTWAGAAAPDASVELIVSASTNVTDGILLSEVFIIDNVAGDIMTESFSGCEADVTSAEATTISQQAEQAAAEGITYLVSTGDNGAEGCDSTSESSATGPVSVNVLASTPYTVAVGGTQFNEGANSALYWSASNGTLAGTAKSYIPEGVWNQSCTPATCPAGVSPNIGAGSGGSSSFFAKPAWQSGVQGLPQDGVRDLPDIALNASAAHDPYLLCLEHSCEANAQGQIVLYGAGGTSASAPSFAGIMALVVQKLGGKQGQANYVLYDLAARETLSQCSASSQAGLPASTCVFNDVTVGNNAVPGEPGYGTSGAKYQSGLGYDLASGLGSVNATNLVNNWATVRTTPSQVSAFTLNPTTNIQHGTTPVSYNVMVSPKAGSGMPTGDVSVIAQVGIDGLPIPAASGTLANGSLSGTTNLLPGGTYNVIAHYAGDGTFLPSDSAPVQITVTPESSSIVLSAFEGAIKNAVAFASGSYGSPYALSAVVSGHSGNGTPTGLVEFSVDGAPFSPTGPSASVGNTGQAVLPSSSISPLLSPGGHSVAAEYLGDISFNSSASNAVMLTITPASTRTSVESSPLVAPAGQYVTLTATVTATSLGNAPTGMVTFFSGQTLVGAGSLSVSLQSAPGVVVASATFTTNQLPAGQDSITAQYDGDANYAGSTSAAIPVSVGASFVIAANPTTIVVASPGQSGSTMLTFTAQNGLTGFATLTSAICANLPSESTCAFSPSTISFSSSTTNISVMMTVSTQAPSAVGPSSRRVQQLPRPKPGEVAAIWMIALLLMPCGTRLRRVRTYAVALILLAAIASASGCGGGGSGGSGGGGGGNAGTPAGSYAGVTVTVTIGGVTQSLSNLTVTVQ